MEAAEPIEPRGPLLGLLVEPSGGVTDRSERRTARLLSTILLLLAPLATLSALLQLGGGFDDVHFSLLGAVTAILVAYAISRTRHFRVAGAITTLIPTAVGLSVVIADPVDPGWFAFMTLNPALGALLLPIRLTAALAVVNLGAVFLGAAAVPGVDADTAVVAVMFNAIVSAILLTAALFRDRLEHDRQADLVARQQLQESILAGTFGGMAVLRGDVIGEANEAFSRMFGSGPIRPGTPLTDLLDPASAQLVSRARTMEDDRPFEITAPRDDGTSFVAEVVVRRVAGGSADVVAIRDISDRRAAERAVLRAERMESVGRLAAGIAHDTNNELFVVSALTHRARDECRAAGIPTDSLDQIDQATERIATLIRRVLVFGRDGERTQVDVADFLAERLGIWQQVLGDEVRLELDVADPAVVSIDPGRFEQLLFNLVVNARDATGDGGWVRVDAADVTIDETTARRIGLRPGGYHRIAVVDSGAGISDEHLGQVFDPFFTTKDDRGTGLGLYTARQIARDAGGEITIESHEAGTTFALHLPLHGPVGSPPAEPETSRQDGHDVVSGGA